MIDVLFKNTSYAATDLGTTIHEIMDGAGADRIQPGMRVLIKPNLLLPAVPEVAVTTHPLVVKAVVAYVLEKGALPVVADSPGMGSFEKILSKGGYLDATGGLDVVFRPFRESVSIDIGKPFGLISLAREALQADFVINLAKLKTHAQMLLTLGVKNMFGCVIGLKKPEWHLKAGLDRALFARLLVQICRTVAPGITIVDGITALEGQGPGKSGTPRKLGLIAGSRNAYAVDMTLCKVLGLDPAVLQTHRAAQELGLLPENINLKGRFHVIDDFVFPDIGPLTMGPKMLHGFMRRNIIQKPIVNNKDCRLCGKCWKYCPAKAITHHIKGIRFNYDTCIRCYCCLEICPHGVIHMHEPLLGRVLRPYLQPSESHTH
jgi:uncharacterized protein (DUF362 family)/Pyruvate/2-oxoacid:ferredoxin oxidoreductase delta subunit